MKCAHVVHLSKLILKTWTLWSRTCFLILIFRSSFPHWRWSTNSKSLFFSLIHSNSKSVTVFGYSISGNGTWMCLILNYRSWMNFFAMRDQKLLNTSLSSSFSMIKFVLFALSLFIIISSYLASLLVVVLAQRLSKERISHALHVFKCLFFASYLLVFFYQIKGSIGAKEIENINLFAFQIC